MIMDMVICWFRVVYKVNQTIWNILSGAAVIIQPTLALSTDQSSKIDFANITDYAIVGIQCDSIKASLAFKLLEKTILNVDGCATANIFFYFSGNIIERSVK